MFNLLFIIGGQAWVSMHCWFNVFFFSWHINQWWITEGFVTVCCSNDMMSMVSKTLCSHFYCQGSYYTAHTLGLNFTMKSSAESLVVMSLCMALIWSKFDYCMWFDGTVFEHPALVCHGPQSHSWHHWVCSYTVRVHRVNFHWTWICFSTCANLKFPFVQFKISVYGHTYTDLHTHASCNVVWESLRVAPNNPSQRPAVPESV